MAMASSTDRPRERLSNTMQQCLGQKQDGTVVVLFYKYFHGENSPQILRDHSEHFEKQLYEHQQNLCQSLGLKGRVLLSREGINGTVSANKQHTMKRYIEEMTGFDLFVDCCYPKSCTPSVHGDEKGRLFAGIDWKTSVFRQAPRESESERICSDVQEPFPDLKISIVKEIVSSGGALDVEEIPVHGGKHLSPRQFHDTLERDKDVILVDVRSSFEFNIGHFVSPLTNQPALHPNMVTFSSFDSSFCTRRVDELKGKKVLMYCTGGIRCEKASAMLRKRGVEDVSQLAGGIHRYMESFPQGGYFKGKNFVFDRRVAIEKNSNSDIVGQCIECSAAYDEISGSRICSVCRDLVLVCPECQTTLREYHCQRHASWKDCYFTFLEPFTENDLKEQKEHLLKLRDKQCLPASKHRSVRRTLSRQIRKVDKRICELNEGRQTWERNAPKRCRSCMETSAVCDGLCWGFWKSSQRPLDRDPSSIESALVLTLGDRVQPGPSWNPLRLGAPMDSTEDGMRLKQGTVVERKSWASDSLEKDCAVVVWDGDQQKDRKIYRWGFIARNGKRMYDLQVVKVVDPFGKTESLSS